jgi:hypothetical protein
MFPAPEDVMQFDPFWLFRSPLSGNVAEKISAPWFSPEMTVNYAGDSGIEAKVVGEIASYGTQIGWLNEVVLGLAKGAHLPEHLAKTVECIAEATARIEELKEANRKSVLASASAIASLDRLKNEQPAAYGELLRLRTQGVLK